MHRLVRALQRSARFAAWRYEGYERSADGTSATMNVGGPEGMGISLTISATMKAGRGAVDATFSLAQGTDETAAQPAIKAMVAAMQRQESGPGRR